MKTKSFWGMTALLGGALLSSGSLASAQTATTGRLAVVEIKNATLEDAINLVFRSAGVALPILDESTKTIAAPDITLNNVAWDDVIRQLAPARDWRFYKGVTGQYIVEPRAPQIVPGQEGLPFGAPGGAPSSPFGANPFGANPFGGGSRNRAQGGRTQGNQLVRPGVETLANSQTLPRVPGARGARQGGGGGNSSDQPLQYRIINVRHVYAGGIALLFGGSVLSTEQFVSPESSGGLSGGTNGGIGVSGTGGGGISGGLGGGGGGLGGGLGGGGGIGGGIGGAVGGGGFGGGF
jgi:hypothetical protein